MRTTIVLREGIPAPSMLKGFDAVCVKFPEILPRVRIHRVADVDEAANFVRLQRGRFFGLH